METEELLSKQELLSMETEDSTKFISKSNTGPANENDDQRSGCEAIGADYLPINSVVKEEVDSQSLPLPLNSEVKEEIDNDPLRPISDGLDEDMDLATTDVEEDEEDNVPTQPGGFELTESVAIAETMASMSTVHTENGSLDVLSENSFKEDGILLNGGARSSSLSGSKRRRMDLDEQQPSVHVIYNSLTRESKLKLEELLQQWSRWHSQNCKSSNDSNMLLESGEETYFPALNVGLDKPSAVTFWMDNQTKIQSNKEFIPLDGTSVPLYDRGYSSSLISADGSSGLDREVDTSRCFNCGSYSHALKDCSKPRDNVAVNNARKQHKSRRSQQANSRNSTRYYQTSRGGKYDGLTPGVLDAETRQLLGLGELDPPPWLNRMRELGYPPGYLDADIEDQPSGITIFGDETNKQEGEEGEILDSSQAEPPKKKSVEFPGINAPIPKKADKWLWLAGSSNSNNNSREQSHYRYHSSESFSRGHYTERRWIRDFDDEGPPGCDPGTSPSPSNYYHKYGDYDSSSYSGFSPTRPGSSRQSSSGFGRTISDRGRRSPFVRDGSPDYGRYDTLPYSSPRYYS